jgi:small conductance mechanosensitive channel
MTTQLPRQLPTDTPTDTAALTDTLDFGIGRSAARLLEDPLRSIPAQFREWGITMYVETVRLLPQIILALVVAAVIVAATLLIRNQLRARVDEEADTPGTSLSVIGVLLAAMAASAILGAATLSAALLTFTIFYALAAGLRAFRGAAMRRWEASPEAVELMITVGRYALLTVGTVDALATLGLNLGGVLAGLGILGLAVGFAAQDSLANLIAGFVILWDRPFRVGHWVRIGDNVEGRIRRMTLRTTRLETLDDGIMVLPNKEVTGSRIYNYSLRNLTRVRAAVDVNYDADILAARRVMEELVPDDDFISPRPEPFVAVTALGDSAVRLELVLFITEPREMYGLRWRLNEAILLAFRTADIEITYPHLNLHLREGTAALDVRELGSGV